MCVDWGEVEGSMCLGGEVGERIDDVEMRGI